MAELFSLVVPCCFSRGAADGKIGGRTIPVSELMSFTQIDDSKIMLHLKTLLNQQRLYQLEN